MAAYRDWMMRETLSVLLQTSAGDAAATPPAGGAGAADRPGDAATGDDGFAEQVKVNGLPVTITVLRVASSEARAE